MKTLAIQFLLGLISASLLGQNSQETIRIFPAGLEKELALSSLPEHLRSNASVYVYKQGKGYEKAKEGTNGFTALVERVPGFPTAFAPVSYDEEGSRTHVPRILDVGKWLSEGVTADEIRSRVAMKFLKNEYQIPTKTGISYMLSPVNYLPSPSGKPALYYPHYMIYASHVKPEDLGIGKFQWHSYGPIVLDQGPHGLLVIRLGDQETDELRKKQKDLVTKMEAQLGAKLSTLEIAKDH